MSTIARSTSTALEPKKSRRFKLIDPSPANLGSFFFFALLFLAGFFYFNYDTRINMGIGYFPGMVALTGSTNGSSPAPTAPQRPLMVSHVYGNGRPGFLEEGGASCDVFEGNWVWDESYPLHKSMDCPFMDGGFRCSEHGRPNDFAEKWRWQPRDCNLPRFDGGMMLEKLRNRRVVFAGDSISRNSWESLLCMLSTAVSNKSSIYEVNGNPITKHMDFLIFKFEGLNCTVEYYRSPYLVPRGRPSGGAPAEVRQTLRVDRMDWACDRWRGADLLVLSSGHWWNRGRTIGEGCYFQEGRKVKMNMSVDDAFRRSIETMVHWVNTRIDKNKTHVFFRSYSPTHFRGGTWNTGGGCHKDIVPDLNSSVNEESSQYNIASEVISQRSNGFLDLLNVTRMTWRRRDGHPSIYSSNWPNVSIHKQDCSHWCLPGVPDSWNELLYTLFLKQELAKQL